MTRKQIEAHMGKTVIVKHDGADKECVLHGVSGSGDYVEVGLAQLVHRDTVLKLSPNQPKPAESAKPAEPGKPAEGETGTTAAVDGEDATE
jgi:hypothetical protein